MRDKLIKFPKYSREENLACKLTDDNIRSIRRLRKQGESYYEIAKHFSVSPQTIYYWCIDEAKRHAIIQKQIERKGKEYMRARNLEQRDWFKEYRARKKKLHPELTEYERSFDYKHKQSLPNYYSNQRKSDKKYYWKHREKRLRKYKIWQSNHLDMLREYNRNWREKHPEKLKEYYKKDYQKNRIKILARNKERYRRNRDIIKKEDPHL